MKESKPSKQTVVTWHPNFRVVAALPDIKVIRTSFLISAVAVSVMLLAAVLLVRHEQELATLRSQIGSPRDGGLEKEIADDRPKLEQAKKLQKEFTDTEKKVREIASFTSGSVVASEFLAEIARSLPRLVTIDLVSMQGGSIRLHGTLVGAKDRASTRAKEYVEKLSRDPILAATVESVVLIALTPDQNSGRLSFDIEMKLKPRK